jgi:hypothetical protein
VGGCIVKFDQEGLTKAVRAREKEAEAVVDPREERGRALAAVETLHPPIPGAVRPIIHDAPQQGEPTTSPANLTANTRTSALHELLELARTNFWR